MKIIDKIIITTMGLLILKYTNWNSPIIFIGLLPIIYSIIYLIKVGLEKDQY